MQSLPTKPIIYKLNCNPLNSLRKLLSKVVSKYCTFDMSKCMPHGWMNECLQVPHLRYGLRVLKNTTKKYLL